MKRPRPIAGDAALDELSGVIGEAAALDLARQLGGTGVYVPHAIGDHHPVCMAIGREAADRLAAWAGGSEIYVPKQAERRARVLMLRGRPLTQAQIARETGFSERHVRRLLKEDADDSQPGLFDSI